MTLWVQRSQRALLVLLLLWEVSFSFSSSILMTTRASSSSSPNNDSADNVRPVNKIANAINAHSPLHSNLSDDENVDGNHHQQPTRGQSPSPDSSVSSQVGKLEELKLREAELSSLLAEVRREKLETLRSRPLCIGIVGFGRFGQFIAKTFAKYGRVVVTSRSDYSDVAARLGVTYVPLDNPDAFLREGLDVVVFAVSILSFKATVRSFLPSLRDYITRDRSHRAPLMVDVLSVKEHARSVLLDLLPPECDILCTHPMFGPDSGKNGWHNLNFVYEKTRIDRVVLDPSYHAPPSDDAGAPDRDSFADAGGTIHSVHEDSEAHVEGMDRMERFLSIWEEEGCHMVPMSCKDHDAYAANSQFITHLVGRVLGTQGLSATPIDTSGFQSVLKLVDSTTADSFDLFYGLYKYNQNSLDTIRQLQSAMNDVVDRLQDRERQENIRQAAKAFHDEAARNRETS